MLSASYDLGANILTVVFSEPVQAASMGAGAFTVVGGISGTASSNASGAKTSNATQNFNMTATALSGPTGTLTGAAGVSNLVSTATGLAVQPFTGLLIAMSF